MSAAERIKERKKLITDILKHSQGRSVLGADIRKRIKDAFGKNVSKGTLSSDIKALAAEGYEIVSDTDGYKLVGIREMAEVDETKSLEPIRRDTVAKWLIMIILSEDQDRYMSVREICDRYGELTDALSMSGIKAHLEALVKLKYISRHTKEEARAEGRSTLSEVREADNKLFYHISDSAPVLSFIDKEAVMDFNEYYHDGGYAEGLGRTLKTINDKIAAVSQDIYTEGSGVYKSTGIRNDIPKELTDRLDKLLQLPFRKYAIDIKYSEKEKIKDYTLKISMIIFNADMNGFYLLGEVKNKKKWIRKNFKLGSVTQMSVNKAISNDIYESRKYRDIFNKMWSCAPDEPCETEVIFEDIPNVREEIEALSRARSETAQINIVHGTDKTGWIRYRDMIMGTHDFLRFVRTLGDAAVIIKPEKSRKHLIEKTEEMVERYREILKKESAENGHDDECV